MFKLLLLRACVLLALHKLDITLYSHCLGSLRHSMAAVNAYMFSFLLNLTGSNVLKYLGITSTNFIVSTSVYIISFLSSMIIKKLLFKDDLLLNFFHFKLKLYY